MNRTRSHLALVGTLIVLLLASASVHGDESEAARASIDRVLDTFHDAAAKADGPRYFDQLTPDAVFLGTDASERWPKADFRAFAKPYFDKGTGWTYASTVRHVDVESDGRIAWFDELLTNASFGTCRGSGVLRKTDGRWRIAQYNLSIPIPNPLAHEFASRIRTHEADAASTAVIYVVRHADRDPGNDPDLNERGRARARQLARVLRSAGIDRIYATEFKRTQQTVAPIATQAGVDVVRYPHLETQTLAASLFSDTKAKAALVAAHSNTVPALLKHLGVEAPITIGHDDYDNLYVVTLRPGHPPRVQHLHYGR